MDAFGILKEKGIF
jgi:cell cycle checkpoint protein MEC1